MAMVNIFGKMVHIIKVILKMDLEMVMVYGKVVRVIVINMKASLSRIRKKVMEYILGSAAIFIKEIIITIWDMVMGNYFGRMVVFTEAYGKMIYRMAKDNYLIASKSW